jgi:predicted AlkP superfamily pyrophosphatase or phosphodiesterase
MIDMRKCFLIGSALLAGIVAGDSVFAQTGNSIERPKLVVGLVVDQMRWDFLYRYYDRYAPNGGFKRILNKGFTCENTYIPYAPTVTACGHACVYTGSVPNVHGITGNAWYDRLLQKTVYCVEDQQVQTVGANSDAGKMSPRNLLTTTIGDEMKLSNQFRAKVIGIASKDRGAILPAGHAANGAYWYDSKTGNWISSDYYGKTLPKWLETFNQEKWPDQWYQKGWNTLYPIASYQQSTADDKPYEAKPFGSQQRGFPYDFNAYIGKNYGAISVSPHSASMTFDVAKRAIKGEQLGADAITDLLAVSISSTDYIGHSFGPNSIETEDAYLRLDRDLGVFLDYLDVHVGKGQYVFFITADHGVAHVPGFMQENKLPGGVMDDATWLKELETRLKNKFGASKLIASTYNYNITFNQSMIDSLKIDQDALHELVINYLKKQPSIAEVFEWQELAETPMVDKKRKLLENGYFPSRSGDIQFVLKPGYIDGNSTGTTHGVWNPYDTHIPLVWYGWRIPVGKTNRQTYMTDIAPTIAAMLRIQEPSGNVGTVITELTK